MTRTSCRTGCGLLFDVNNVYVTCRNVGGDPRTWIEALPVESVHELHLAGHCVNDAEGVSILIDDHGSAVAPAVWDLFDRTIRRFPRAATLIEWDSNLPPREPWLPRLPGGVTVVPVVPARSPIVRTCRRS